MNLTLLNLTLLNLTLLNLTLLNTPLEPYLTSQPKPPTKKMATNRPNPSNIPPPPDVPTLRARLRENFNSLSDSSLQMVAILFRRGELLQPRNLFIQTVLIVNEVARWRAYLDDDGRRFHLEGLRRAARSLEMCEELLVDVLSRARELTDNFSPRRGQEM